MEVEVSTSAPPKQKMKIERSSLDLLFAFRALIALPAHTQPSSSHAHHHHSLPPPPPPSPPPPPPHRVPATPLPAPSRVPARASLPEPLQSLERAIARPHQTSVSKCTRECQPDARVASNTFIPTLVKCCSCTCHTPSVSMSDSSPTYSFDTTHQDMIHDAQVDYYGNHLATCSSDRTIKIWKLAEDNKPEEIAVIKGHDGPVWQVAWLHPRFAAGGMQILASCGFDGKVCFWQQTPSSQWEMLYEYRHSASVNSVSAAPHDLGCHILSASADGTISMASYSELSVGQGGRFSVQSKAGCAL
jgi:hypothetical protein